MSVERSIRTCTWCGGDFMGFPSSKYCPDCRGHRAGGEKEAAALAAAQELADEREGWRHMHRDGTGTVIVPGGNVMNALDDLCAYEEACQAAGIHGPQELRKTLERYRIEKALAKPVEKKSGGKRGERTATGPAGPRNDSQGMTWTGDAEYNPNAKRRRKICGLFCESCGHYQPTTPTGSRGICPIHPRRVRADGGHGGPYVVLNEPRICSARRVACGDWTPKDKKQGGENHA